MDFCSIFPLWLRPVDVFIHAYALKFDSNSVMECSMPVRDYRFANVWVDYRICRIRDVTSLIGGTHGGIGEPH